MLRNTAKSLFAVVFLLALPVAVPADEPVSFTRDVQPILAGKCFACHGPDEQQRQADLRLDRREIAIDLQAVVPGKPDESGVVERIFSTDPDIQMPPPDSGETLTDMQKELLKNWIEQGAIYEQHWAFVPPVRPKLPAVHNEGWCRNEIDRFVLARLEAEKLSPSEEADRYTLIRRLSLDLIGLLPTPEEADAFVQDTDPQAYEKLVDRLLESEHYGERWARLWLDLARYSDTNGYEKDRPRSIWPYRDWVIRALNNDMPFDQFTIEQLAGDMLPKATLDQKIATGFHRNTMLNEEGGIDPLEYRFYAMVDRVATTGTVWLGLTTGCAQCHSHKYDPISHTDYYRLMALMNNAEEPDLMVPAPDVIKRRQEIETRIAALEEELPNQFPPAEREGTEPELRQRGLEAAFAKWLSEKQAAAVQWTVVKPVQLESNLPKLEVLEDGSIFSSGDVTKRDVLTLTFSLDGTLPFAPRQGAPSSTTDVRVRRKDGLSREGTTDVDVRRPGERLLPNEGRFTALRLEALPDERLPAGGPGRAFYEGRKGDFFLSELTATLDGAPVKFSRASHSYGKISIGSGTAEAKNVIDGDGSTGWSTSGREGESHQLVLNFAEPLPVRGELKLELLFERHFAASLGRFRMSLTSDEKEVKASELPVELEAALANGAGERVSDTPSVRDTSQQLRRQFLLTCPELAEARKPIEKLRKELPDLPTTMVMQERPADNPRPTFRHHRGEFLQTKEEVTPGVPAIFPPLTEGEPANRLTFARWLVSERNPLVARVQADRAWGAFFGTGLVRTSGDYGTQSDPPTHPELLDWLACEFVERDWSMKQLHRLIVTSATYRQGSAITPALLARDPENLLLARGPRFRVDAEIVRDVMLEASGLLSPKMYGPSVYPPQPGSVTALAYGETPWPVSKGEDRYRRSLYTFGKRTAPFAAYTVFDGPTGETCLARRDRSDTPLQALTLLNDEMYLEMAHALAHEAIERFPGGAESVPDTPSVRDTGAEAKAVGRRPEAVETLPKEVFPQASSLKPPASSTDRSRATFIFRRLLIRPPSDPELDALTKFVALQRRRLKSGQLDAAKMTGLAAGASPDVAAWTMLARSIMNLDEAITKE